MNSNQEKWSHFWVALAIFATVIFLCYSANHAFSNSYMLQKVESGK